ncbi:hypothetical protein [Bartonella sp. MM73XJBT.G]|uniref:hypothetical protein n=1 Tax=Bartonella sp. MM73XJBT.G TaxID=3019097 RepID=UPI00236156C9|nr:hypothetical protein [Bartonella sp. MM73XJBT.G]
MSVGGGGKLAMMGGIIFLEGLATYSCILFNFMSLELYSRGFCGFNEQALVFWHWGLETF